MTSACHQIEVFSRVLKTSINSFLEDGEEFMRKSLEKFTVSCCGLIYFWFPVTLLDLLFPPLPLMSLICKLFQEKKYTEFYFFRKWYPMAITLSCTRNVFYIYFHKILKVWWVQKDLVKKFTVELKRCKYHAAINNKISTQLL